MCNRYVSPDQTAIERFWHIGRHNQPQWAKEIFPRAPGPFVRLGAKAAAMIWGQSDLPLWHPEPLREYGVSTIRFFDTLNRRVASTDF